MIKHWPCIVVAMLCSLLAVATSSAEADWVLWESTLPQGDQPMAPTWAIKNAMRGATLASRRSWRK